MYLSAGDGFSGHYALPGTLKGCGEATLEPRYRQEKTRAISHTMLVSLGIGSHFDLKKIPP